MDLFNYSSSPFIPGFDMGNMMAFASPETLVANMANRKKLIEQRSKNREEPIEQSPKVNNYILNKFEKFGRFLGGIPSQEEVEQIRKNNPQMDIFKTDIQLNNEGKVRDKQGNVIDSITGVITESGNKQGTFSFKEYLNDVGKKVKTDLPGVVVDKPSSNYYNLFDLTEGSKEDMDYGKMTEYAKSVIGAVDEVAQRARERDFFREGIRSFANAPLIGAQANLEAAKNIADLTALNMGAMAAQNRVLETNPTKQKIAGKYFR